MKLASPSNTLVLQLLRHLADGKNLAFAAAAAQMTVDQVRDIASHHGYPDQQKMGWAADVIAKNIDDVRRSEGFTVGSAAPTARNAATPPAPAPAPVSVNHTAKLSDPTGELLRRGKQSTKKTTLKLVDRIYALLEQLEARLEAESAAAQARAREAAARERAKRQLEAEKAQALADVKRLEQQLKDAKARLRARKTSKTAPAADAPDRTAQGDAARRRHQQQREFLEKHQVTAGEIRAWANQNGHHCATAGLLPQAVLDAWAQADPGGA
jgi:hypothetical protein